MYNCIQKSAEEFEDTKGVISIRISKKNRQNNGWKKKYKKTNNDLQSSLGNPSKKQKEDGDEVEEDIDSCTIL
jgi:hypothetical protein